MSTGKRYITNKKVKEQKVKGRRYKRELEKSSRFIKICFFSFLILLIYGCIQVTKWVVDDINIKNEKESLEQIANVEEKEDGENTVIVSPQEELDVNDPYYDYIKENFLNVNFDELKNINDETVGWLEVKGTNINYPVVQAVDNEYYLDKTFYNNSNNAGWIFADYRNTVDLKEEHLIIYGHGRVNELMFGSLKTVLSDEWLNNTENYLIKFSSESSNSVWQIFSTYSIPETTDYLDVVFNENFVGFAKMLQDRSIHNFGTYVGENDRILTLSTCYNDNDTRLVVHAKLIKSETN